MMQAFVVANVTVDETYQVDALPQPGESIIGRFAQRDVGGKGANVATVLARAQLPTTLVAAVGDDERGRYIRDRLAEEPLLQARLYSQPGSASDVSLVYRTADGDNAIVTTVVTTRQLDVDVAREALAASAAGDLLILQGNLSAGLTGQLLQEAHQRRLNVVLNPSPWQPWLGRLLPAVQSVFVNMQEAGELTGTTGEKAVHHLLAAGPTTVVVTRGAGGALLGSLPEPSAADSHSIPPAARPTAPIAPDSRLPDVICIDASPARAVDTTGAGDTFLATALASACRRHVRLDALALRQAAAAAAITVSRHGTTAAFPTAPELAAILSGD